jgi:ribonuclease P protein component
VIGRGNRFHGHGSLRFVYQHGKTVRGPLCALKYAPNPKRSSFRLAIVVSKKVSKSAVKRNKIRRRLFEAFREQQDSIKKPYDLVVTVFHEQIAEIPYPDLQKLVIAQLKQAGVIS